MKIAFVDCETTGVDPSLGHEIWEIGLILRHDGGDTEHQWFLKPDLTAADPAALPVGRYYERTPATWSDPAAVAPVLARLLDRAELVGSSVWFDAGFLRAFLRANGECGTWSRHLVDVRQRAIGYLLGKGAAARWDEWDVDSWKTQDIFTRLGVDLGQFSAHEALEDARIARAVYDATGRRPAP
jgi:DNA polymerase III epsilon subunit-like protein